MLNLICIYNIAPYNVVDCLLEHFDSCKLGTLGIWFFLTSRKFRLYQECAPYLLLFSSYLPHAVLPTSHCLRLEFSLKLAMCLPWCRSKQGKLNKLGFQSPMNYYSYPWLQQNAKAFQTWLGQVTLLQRKYSILPIPRWRSLLLVEVEILSFHLKLDCTFSQWRRTCKSHNIAKGCGISSYNKTFAKLQ